MNAQLKPNPIPLAYLITVRTYGTWLHGDKRLSPLFGTVSMYLANRAGVPALNWSE